MYTEDYDAQQPHASINRTLLELDLCNNETNTILKLACLICKIPHWVGRGGGYLFGKNGTQDSVLFASDSIDIWLQLLSF